MSTSLAARRPVAMFDTSRRLGSGRIVALLAAACISVALFFRHELRCGFAIMLTDRYDGEIEISLLEHWYNVFRGLEPWHTPIFLVPAKRTLGFNDGYFLFGVVYSVFRGAGLDPFISADLVAWVTRFVGFFGFFMVAWRVFAYGFWICVLGAMTFTVSNNAFIQSGHAQLLTVGLAPWLALFCCFGWGAAAACRDRECLAWCIASAALLAAWLMTAFYMAWFSMLFAGFLAAIAIACRGRCLPAVLLRARDLAVTLCISALAFFVFLLPFLHIYLPAMRKTQAERVYLWMPSALDLINVSYGNLLFGGALRQVYAVIRPGFDNAGVLESTTGFPPILLLCFVAGAIGLWRAGMVTRSLAGLLVLTIVAVWVVHLRADLPGHRDDTLWSLVNRFVPGAAAIRAVGRLDILLAFPVILVALGAVSAVGRHAPALFIPLFVLLVAEELNRYGAGGNDREAEMARLASIPPAPPGCRVFFAATAREGAAVVNKVYSHNVDAMLIAEMTHLPTINGMASYTPPGWNLSDPTSPTYVARVAAYAQMYRVKGLCGLDLEKRAWVAAPPPPATR